MSVAKRAIVEMTYEEVALSGYEFDPQPDEQFAVLRRLDAMGREQ